MIALWSRLTRRNQNLMLAAFVAVLLIGFFGFEMNRVDRKMRVLGNQISMRTLRAKPAAEAPALSGENPEKLRKEKVLLEQKVAELAAQVAEGDRRLAPIDDTAAQQRLQLQLAQLTQNADVEMERFKLITERSDYDKLAPTVERLRTAFNNEFKRPLYVFTARASYRGLMDVLAGLEQFEYAVVPVNLAVQVQVELTQKQSGGEKRIVRQWLDVEMILAF